MSDKQLTLIVKGDLLQDALKQVDLFIETTGQAPKEIWIPEIKIAGLPIKIKKGLTHILLVGGEIDET